VDDPPEQPRVEALVLGFRLRALFLFGFLFVRFSQTG